MDLIVELVNNAEDEIQTREQLLALLQQYDLRKWLFTKYIRIQRGAIPHSHPVITLSTRYRNDSSRLLATFIHEQLHWFTALHPSKVNAAVAGLRALYPQVPVGYPEGSRSEYSTYSHLIICYLEYQALVELVGLQEATRVFDSLSKHHYTWIYKAVRADADRIGAIVRRHGLIL